LDTRLKSFGETLNQRLESFENRITQSECSKKSTIQNGCTPSSDHGSLVESIFNKFIDITVARMSEGDLEKYLQYLIDLYDLQIKNGNVTKANIPFDWEKHVKHLITQYNIMVKNGDLTKKNFRKSITAFDPKDMNMNNIMKKFKIWKEKNKLNQETIKNGDLTEENVPKTTLFDSEDLNMSNIMKEFKIWKEENKLNQETIKNGDLTEKNVPKITDFDPKDLNMNNMIKKFKIWKENKLGQEKIKSETSPNENYDKTVKKASTDYMCTDRTSTHIKLDESERDLKSIYDAMQIAIKDYRSWQNSLNNRHITTNVSN